MTEHRPSLFQSDLENELANVSCFITTVHCTAQYKVYEIFKKN